MPTSERPLYLDHHATTPLAREVLEAMMPYLTDEFGNSSSRHHAYGQRVHDAVESARTEVASVINCQPDEIHFTSGATESNNLAIRGAMLANAGRGNHLVTVATEHKAVLEVAEQLAKEGFEITVLPVDVSGLVDLNALERAIRPTTVLVSIMHANNEIGVIQDIAGIGRLCREHGALFHTDAAQSVGKLPVDVQASSIDLLSLSGHKIFGPKGVGALFARRRKPRVKLAPIMHGGGHERGLRSGTLNSPAIVGLGAACALGGKEIAARAQSVSLSRDQLWTMIQQAIPGVQLNGSSEHRLAGNLNFRLPDVDAEALIYRVRLIALSSGAACTTTKIEPSHVLTAIGLTEREALSSLRIGLGAALSAEELELVVRELSTAYAELRELIAT